MRMDFIDMGKSAVLKIRQKSELGKRYEAGDHSPVSMV